MGEMERDEMDMKMRPRIRHHGHGRDGSVTDRPRHGPLLLVRLARGRVQMYACVWACGRVCECAKV